MGRMWMTRRSTLPSGWPTTITVYGVPTTLAATEYLLTAEIDRHLPQMFDALRYLEQHGYAHGPGNLDLALRSFMSSYDRWPSPADSQLIDLITALESVLGTETEITFRLAFRVAGLLANDDAERRTIFHDVKAFYDTRCKLVHGSALKPKHQMILQNVARLKDYVRRLLTAFVIHASQPSPIDLRNYFAEQLDDDLQSASARQTLRVRLGFEPVLNSVPGQQALSSDAL